MKLLTDGTEKDLISGFCQAVISRHMENWPPTEKVLAEEFVNWLGVKCFQSRDAMRELCLCKGINLSFIALPPDLHGFNCTFQDKKEIVLSEREVVAFAHLHTLFHEFREMLECIFVELGYATLTPEDCLEAKAENFAIIARMETGTREMPAYFDMVRNIETTWQSYFGYAFLGVFFAFYMFSCAFLPQFEEMISEARR
jgi:hypothetical protein